MKKGTLSEIAHSWASQSESSMTTANGSYYFNGNIIYSYGSHFPIGKLINNVVLFTTDTYSNTTAKHLSKTRQAITHKTVFNVPDVLADNEKEHIDNFIDYESRFNELLGKASRARQNKEFYLERALNLATEANNYAEYFNLSNRINSENIDLNSIKEKLNQLKEEKRKKEKARKAQLLIDNAEKIKQWRNGENVSLPYDIGFLLRVNGDIIETSQRASIPVDQAIKLWPLILKVKKSGKTLNINNYKLGNYSLTRIDNNGHIKVGCHHIKFEELENIARELELI